MFSVSEFIQFRNLIFPSLNTVKYTCNYGYCKTLMALPIHSYPFPLKPSSHTQRKLPGVLIQAASASQTPLSIKHSLLSVMQQQPIMIIAI